MKPASTSAENPLSIIGELRAENAQLRQQVQWFMEQLKLAKHKQINASSEQTLSEQLSLFNEAEATALLSAPKPEIIGVRTHTRKKTRLTTDRLPEDLPAEVVEHELPEDEHTCPDCGGALHRMGRETRDALKIIPAKAVIIRHIQYIYAYRGCAESSGHVPIIKATMPEPVVKGGCIAGSDCAYRGAEVFHGAAAIPPGAGIGAKRDSAVPATMANWLIKASELWLEPIYNAMKARLVSREAPPHADETTNQVLHEPGETARSKSYMWLYRTGGDAKHPIVLYEYQPSRQHAHPKEF